MSKMIVELVWDGDNLGEHWMNDYNLGILLFTDQATTRELLKVREIDDHSIIRANELLTDLSKAWYKMKDVIDDMDIQLGDMDDFLTKRYNDDGVSHDIRKQYNERLKESFTSCGWCGGHVFVKVPYIDGPHGTRVPGSSITYVDHKGDCPFRE